LPSVIDSIVGLKPNILLLKLIGENVFQADFQFYKNRFQFIQSEMVLTMFNAVKRLVRDTGPFGKFCIGKSPPFLSQEFRQLMIQIVSHAWRMAKNPSRMRDDFSLQAAGNFVKSGERA
jgi:hypothetical protein